MAGPSGSHPHHAQRPGNLKRAREEIVVDPTVQLLGDLFYLGNDALPVRGIGRGSWCRHSPGGCPTAAALHWRRRAQTTRGPGHTHAMQTLRMEKGSVVHVVQRLRRRMGQDAGGAADALLKCVFRLPHKIPLYALLIGKCTLLCVRAMDGRVTAFGG